MIRQYHAEVGHSGAGYTWASIRQRYWILKGGAAVRKSLGQCILCKRRSSVVGKQLMADVPECRLQYDHPPFYSVGVNYFGPFTVKQGRSTVKRYGCVFTCLTMRAIHTEISHSLDTDSLINVLRRFIARRGKPHQIFSDDGTNFVGAERILRTALLSFNNNRINNYGSQEGIEWTFNPPLASHMGGAWERMIRTIRKVLRSLLENQSMNDESCLTLMAEIESIINSRPLVPISFSDSSQEPLTPNHLLLMQGSPNLPPGLFTKDDNYSKRRWAQVQYLSNQFWRQWLKEFLPNLLQRQKWFKETKNLQVNDVVLLVEDTQQRSRWVLGRVLETYVGKNGLARTVLVKTQSSVLKQPITTLCPLVTESSQTSDAF